MEMMLLSAAVALILLASVAKAFYYREVVLLNQDYNPIALSRAYWRGIPDTADDFELGGNCAAFVFSSLTYSLPVLALGRTGRIKWFIRLHLAVVPVGVFLGTYLLGDALCGPMGGLLAAGLILAFPRRLFGFLNLCYPLLLDRYYYNEMAYIPLLGGLAAAVNGNEWAAGIGMAVTVLINPTLGLAGGGIVLLGLTFAGLVSGTGGLPLAAAGLLAAACVAEFVVVKAKQGGIAPAPGEARKYAIRIYSHISPHIHDLKGFLRAVAATTAALACAAAFEGLLRPVLAPSALGFALGCLAGVAVALPAYVLFYTWLPQLLPMLVPVKAFMVTAFVVTAYAGGALAWMIGLLPESLSGWVFAAVFLGVLAKAMWYLAGPFRDGSLRRAKRFLDIQLQAREALPPEAVVVPWRPPGVAHRPIGSFAQFPFRTFSERGAMIFWSLGRNAYFNSRLRHDCECRAFSYFGVDDPWEHMQERIDGLGMSAWDLSWGERGNSGRRLGRNAFIREYSKLKKMQRDRVGAMTFEEFGQYAEHLGATHVLVSTDAPGDADGLDVIAANDQFALVPVPTGSMEGKAHA